MSHTGPKLKVGLPKQDKKVQYTLSFRGTFHYGNVPFRFRYVPLLFRSVLRCYAPNVPFRSVLFRYAPNVTLRSALFFYVPLLFHYVARHSVPLELRFLAFLPHVPLALRSDLFMFRFHYVMFLLRSVTLRFSLASLLSFHTFRLRTRSLSGSAEYLSSCALCMRAMRACRHTKHTL